MNVAKVLLTGFEPFDGARLNPSWDAVQLAAPRLRESGLDVRIECLPVAFAPAGDIIRELVHDDFDVVVCTGLAEGRDAVTPERVALNLDDARIPDAAGMRPREQAIATDGPVAYFSSLPVTAITGAIEHAGIPARTSLSAGAYVCNHVFYALMHALATRERTGGEACARAEGKTGMTAEGKAGVQVEGKAGAKARVQSAGFIHVPATPEYAAERGKDLPTLPLDDLAEALELAVHTSLPR